MITSQGLIQLGFKSGDFVLRDGGNGVYIEEWLSNSAKPTTAEIEAAHAVWQDAYDATEYARKRKEEYPSIEELVVALYDTDDKADIETKRAAVKAKYPKPA